MLKDNFTEQGVAPYGMRHGSITPKGKGYFGELKRPDGDSSTELSSEFEYKGKKVEYPLIVPTLSASELNHLLSGKAPTDDIYNKAESWAKSRVDADKSPFASSTGNEKFPIPEESNNYAQGGAVNDMNTLFAEGGMNEEGGTVDPVSGNEVPAGSLQKEVRDDIPAQLSEGEFVLPADVVRYIGLDRLMKIRDKAKEGLARMEEIGQMGNAEQAASPEEPHGDEFASEIDSIMSELDSEGENNNMAIGGMPTPSTGFEVKQFKTPDGSSMFVTFINGEPATTIPEGAQEVNIATQAQKDQASLTSTEKSVSNKSNIGTKEKMLSSIENVDERFDRMFYNKLSEVGTERRNQKAINENIQFDSNAFKPTDSELSTFSDAADYRLTDGMEDAMLSGSMNEAAAPMTPEIPVGLNTMPDVSAIGPELAMAKGGLVARRKK
jgi:hypothetical protein